MEGIYATAAILGIIGWAMLGVKSKDRGTIRTIVGILIVASAVLLALSGMFSLPVVTDFLAWFLHWLGVFCHWLGDVFESGSVAIDRTA